MSNFTGSQLKQIRESKHIALEQVAKATRIQLSILRDIEDEEYAGLASSTQVRGFLRIYAKYLGLETNDQPEDPPTPAQPDKKQLPKVSKAKKNAKSIKQLKPAGALTTAHTDSVGLPSNSRSSQILTNIGNELIARRRYLDLPWDVIVEQTHIQKDYLLALERGEIHDSVTPIQARGLLQNYARFLNLDVDRLMVRFADALQERRLEMFKSPKKPRKTASEIPPLLLTLKRFFTLDLFFGSMMVLGILAFLIWGMARMTQQNKQSPPASEVPAMIDILLTTPTEEVLIKATLEQTENPEELPTATPIYTPIESDAPVQLVIIARQGVWVRVTQDGKIAFEGRLAANTATAFTADELIELETGNAAALEFVLNDLPEPHANQIGSAARFTFNQGGMSESQIIITPTPSPTPAQ